jgi:hypothetical protein
VGKEGFKSRPDKPNELQELEERLKAHDWTYMMSDDNRAYARGYEQSWRIDSLVESLGERGEELYQKYKQEVRV